MIAFRHCDPRFPFLWEDTSQPAARWHAAGDGPAHYFADTPDGAWAEFLRHEEITLAEDLPGVRRAMWAVDVPEPPGVEPELDAATMVGGSDSYEACQSAASQARASGAGGLVAPSAALEAQGARGFVVDAGLCPGPERPPRVIVLFGPRPDLVGWRVAGACQPPEQVIEHVRPLM